MSPEVWRRIEALFHEAAGLPAAAREALLRGVEEDVARQVRAIDRKSVV